MSAAFPSLVQLIESSISTDEKVDYVLEYVHTLPTLDVLSFRFCLEYAKGTLSEHADIDWTGRVYPLVQERLGGAPLRTDRPRPYD